MKRKIKFFSSQKNKSKRFTFKTNKDRTIIDVNKMEISAPKKGYVHVHINTCEDSEIPSIALAKTKRVETISLFIAGGKSVDEKVARANAMIRVGKSGGNLIESK